MIDFLKEYGINESVINDITNTYSKSVLFNLSCNEYEIEKIINYLKTIGIKDVNEVLSNNLNLFFQTSNDIQKTFSKYDIKKLVEYINYDSSILEELN